MLCELCVIQSCLTSGKPYKPCKHIEKILRDQGIYSSDYIRPQVSKETWTRDGLGRFREISVHNIDKIAEKRAYKLK